ncbi:hypothetical protein BC828DRAFT_167143 [Blastocladiella britannica]|nr:hypothetical protein BC828DRAFT_167143 [Blastocladiella britannica]
MSVNSFKHLWEWVKKHCDHDVHIFEEGFPALYVSSISSAVALAWTSKASADEVSADHLRHDDFRAEILLDGGGPHQHGLPPPPVPVADALNWQPPFRDPGLIDTLTRMYEDLVGSLVQRRTPALKLMVDLEQLFDSMFQHQHFLAIPATSSVQTIDIEARERHGIHYSNVTVFGKSSNSSRPTSISFGVGDQLRLDGHAIDGVKALPPS